MANAFYVTITGTSQGEIKGDVRQEGREDTIRGYAFTNATTIPRHVDTGQPSGTRTHHPVNFSKHVDEASPLLWQAMTTGETLEEVIFDFYKIDANGENKNYYSVTLRNAIIVEMRTSLEDTSTATGTQAEDIREYIDITYQEIVWEHKDAGKMTSDSWIRA